MSDKKSSLDLSNINDTHGNFILKKQRSHELVPISDVDVELSIDPYKRKKTESPSIINLSPSSRNNMTVDDFYEEDNQNGDEKSASNIAISPDGQYICTFDSSKYTYIYTHIYTVYI